MGRIEDRAAAIRRLRRAAATWMALVLGSVVLVATLVVWHLVRRGRLIRDRLGDPKVVRLPELPDRGPPP